MSSLRLSGKGRRFLRGRSFGCPMPVCRAVIGPFSVCLARARLSGRARFAAL
ncbi:hypothetical protein HMPREF1249_0898 [Jonquetella sp. BV3C21]|nr:hypothetical protein GCWU000246_00384 [Jonquetella anthropi E3_33 E1]ERL23416.1 hypothetical protein HMPREF1249_0898 [Jonquetella sp. BV3C21]